MSLIDQFLGSFGVGIERRPPPRADITAVESAVAIGRIFDANCERQKIDHEIGLRGGPRIASNAGSLGRHRGWLSRTINDWLL